MRIDRAVVTAAGPGQHDLPLQKVVDRDGNEKSALQMVIEEVNSAGIEQLAIVLRPGAEKGFERAAGPYSNQLTFIPQDEPAGYGDALLRAGSFADDQPILHLVGDHLYLSGTADRCARQLIQVAEREGCCVSAVQATRETKLPYFGAVGGTLVPRHPGLYEVATVVEKPTPTEAEQRLVVPGLRAGYYLCFFGMHVLTPAVFAALRQLREQDPSSRPTLSEGLAALVSRERYLALEIEGTRFDIGVKYGLLNAQLAISLSGVDRDEILTELIELLASGNQRPSTGQARMTD